MATKQIIEISKWNKISDFELLKNKLDGVIVRCGFRGSTKGAISKDFTFDNYITKLYEVGIPVGVSFNTAAINKEEAKEEAEFVINSISKLNIKLSFPIFLNINWVGATHTGRSDFLSVKDRSEIAMTFINECKDRDYQVCINTTYDWLINKLDSNMFNGISRSITYVNEDYTVFKSAIPFGHSSYKNTKFIDCINESIKIINWCEPEVEIKQLEKEDKPVLEIGRKISIEDHQIYTTCKSKTCVEDLKTSDSYYLFDKKPMFGRVRITKLKKDAINQNKDKVIGWMNYKDIQ